MKIAIATCRTLPEEDVDETITLAAFRDRGHHVELLPWEDGPERFADFDGVIIRSTWNYPLYVEAFSTWIQETSRRTKMLNPAEIILGNLDKRYLSRLAERGIDVVPSEWFLAGDHDCLDHLLTRKSVIKPTVGAGSMDTRVFEPEKVEAAKMWLAKMDPRRMFMIQPFMNSVRTVGEQSIVVIGGEPLHRIHKHPRFADGHERVEGPFEVSSEFEVLVQAILEPLHDQLLYARVDLMMNGEGKWILSELEMIEPSLFFRQNPKALPRFVERAEQMLNS